MDENNWVGWNSMFFLRRISRFLQSLRLKRRKVFVCSSSNISGSEFEGFNELCSNVFFVDSMLGLGSYVKEGCMMKKTRIGRFSSIAPRVRIVYGEHLLNRNVSLHPALYKGRCVAGLEFVSLKELDEYRYSNGFFCEIGNDVWICADVVIRGGVKVGNGAVIAAGSVVVKDVPPYSVVGGNPAKIIRYRFNKEEVEFLEKIEWWNRDFEWISRHALYFDDVDLLKRKMMEEGEL